MSSKHFINVFITFFVIFSITKISKQRHALGNQLDLRIMGGEEAKPHEAPYVVYIQPDKDGWVGTCAGTLISPSHILTVGHCLCGFDRVHVLLGAHDLRVHDKGQKIVANITTWTLHPSFDNDTFTNDIGVLELPIKVAETPQIKYVNLPTVNDRNKRYVNQKGTVYGWGLLGNESPSLVLMKATVPVIDKKTCEASFDHPINKFSICTSASDGKGPCDGDTGAPLLFEEKEKKTQVGIVSYVDPKGCQTGMPTVYVDIAQYIEWINEVIKK